MGKIFRNMAILVAVAFAATGCFKKVTTDTTLRIKVLSESVSGGGRVAAEGCYGYIYYVDGDWTVASYEDAVAKTITNTKTRETRNEPDGESEPYVLEGSVNNYLSIFQDNPRALVVVVYPEARMYAYIHRNTEAENLPNTYLTLIFHTWKSGEYTEGPKEGYKWTVVAPAASETPETETPETETPTEE
jgi:hypothetical protein